MSVATTRPAGRGKSRPGEVPTPAADHHRRRRLLADPNRLVAPRPTPWQRLVEAVLAVCLLLLPLASAWASTVTVAGLPPVRLLVVVFVAAVLVGRQHLSTVTQVLVVVTLVWTAVGLFLVEGEAGPKEVLGVIVGLVTMIAMTMTVTDRRWMTRLCRAWFLGLVVACLPAGYEIATGRHMPNYLEGSSAWIRRKSTDIASFMVNPNLFAYFLAAGMIVMVVGWQTERGRWRWAYLAAALVVPPLVLLTGSRLTLAVVVVVLVWMLLRSRVLALVTAVGVPLAALAVVVTGQLPALLADISLAIYNLTSTSGQSRLHLYRNAAWLLERSGGLGFGPGQFQTLVLTAPWPTYGSVDPHNGFTEVIGGYGIVLGGLVLGLAAATLWRALRREGRTGRSDRDVVLAQAVAVSMVVVPLLSMANSSYLKSPVVWAQMGTIAVWCQALMVRSGVVARLAPRASSTGPSAPRALPRRLRTVRRVNRRRGVGCPAGATDASSVGLSRCRLRRTDS